MTTGPVLVDNSVAAGTRLLDPGGHSAALTRRHAPCAPVRDRSLPASASSE